MVKKTQHTENQLCQGMLFVTYGEWNMTPRRVQMEATGWLWVMRAEILAPYDVEATCAVKWQSLIML